MVVRIVHLGWWELRIREPAIRRSLGMDMSTVLHTQHQLPSRGVGALHPGTSAHDQGSKKQRWDQEKGSIDQERSTAGARAIPAAPIQEPGLATLVAAQEPQPPHRSWTRRVRNRFRLRQAMRNSPAK